MSTTGYEATLAAARRLPLAERLRLASALVGEAAGELHPAPVRQPLTPAEAKAAWAQLRESMRDLPADADAWDELLHFGDDLTTLPPLAQDSAEVLSAMRR